MPPFIKNVDKLHPSTCELLCFSVNAKVNHQTVKFGIEHG